MVNRYFCSTGSCKIGVPMSHNILVSFLRGSALVQGQPGWPMVVPDGVQVHFPATQAVVPWSVLSLPLYWGPFVPLRSALPAPTCGGTA